jgi:hypothetical protein
MQLSPYRAGLAGRHDTRLPVPPAFPTGSCPLQLSPLGESMTQESLFELLLTGHHGPPLVRWPHASPLQSLTGRGRPRAAARRRGPGGTVAGAGVASAEARGSTAWAVPSRGDRHSAHRRGVA